MDFDHNRLLKRLVNEILGPVGLVQSGKSRFWIDDHGWWVIGVDFGSSGSTRGTYLRVGTAPLWTANGYPQYEVRSRWKTAMANTHGTEFIGARRPEWWERDIRSLANSAASYVQELRERPHNLDTFLALNETALFDDGIVLALLGRTAEAREVLTERVAKFPSAAAEAEVLSVLDDPAATLARVAGLIGVARTETRLPPVPIEDLITSMSGTSSRASTHATADS